ncbi:MAG: VCBS repeat-containing protein [Bdellovibrionales bacterium]|nr:VCBS repeat-containing protein [Bdellovibrionales bacterium]
MQLFARSYLGALSLLFLINASNSYAQSITMSGPSSTTVKDTDEYFTDVQGHPYDFSDPCDIGIKQFQFSSESLSGGYWSGVVGPNTGTETLILPNSESIVSIPNATNQDCYQFANHLPVDASKYTQASWRSFTTQGDGSFHFLWDKNNGIPTSGWLASYGYFPPGIYVPFGTDWQIFNQDLTELSVPGNSWSGSINNIMLRWNTAVGPGDTIGMSWFRLVNMDNSPTVNLSWNSSGGGSGAYVHLYMDYDNTDYNGQAVERFHPTSSSIAFKTGVLPPGTYYFYTELARRNGSSEQVLARSNHIGPITINGKATARFLSPSRLNSSNPNNQEEYFRDVVGNPADFSDASDLSNLDPNLPQSWRWFHNWSFEDGLFIATPDTDPNPDPNVVDSDTQLHHTIPTNKPIDPSRFYIYCFRMTMEWEKAPRTGEAADLNDLAHLVRVVAAKTGTSFYFQSKGLWLAEKGVESFPSSSNGYDRSSMLTYCTDLSDPETAHIIGGTSHWYEGTSGITHLRLDPTETQLSDPPRFAIDQAWLLGANTPDESDNFPIQFVFNDPEAKPASVQLFYDTNKSGYNGTLITTLTGVTNGTRTYNWDTSAVEPGTYYIHISISDSAGNFTRYYADEPVVVGGSTSPGSSLKTLADFDGDNKTDFIVVRRGTGNQAVWYKRRSSNGTMVTEVLGNTTTDVFLPIDVDGDNLVDTSNIPARYFPDVSWHSLQSATQSPFSKYWGLKTDVPVPADYSGDGRSDYAIWRPSDGTWWVSLADNSTLFAGVQWGLPGDIPVPADYDGDGKADFAVWRPSTGEWYARLSTTNYSTAPGQILQRQWGLSMDHPMIGDRDGDGKSDLTVWRPDFGMWYTCYSSNNFNCALGSATQYGLWFDYPVHGDFDGDGKMDMAVWRPTSGTWYWIDSSTDEMKSQQWGLYGDLPLSIGNRQLMSLLPTN